MTSLKIGIDMGGVLANKSKDYEDDTKEHKGLINVDDALDTLLSLKPSGHELYLVSFCGKRRARATREGINKMYPKLFDELYFVKKKTYKKDIIRHLGLDVMIDDTMDILLSCQDDCRDTQLIHFTGAMDKDSPYRKKDENYKGWVCDTWEEIEKLIGNFKDLQKKGEPVNLNKLTYLGN